MAITAQGIGSGLDVAGIVSQLMQLERRPLFALQDKEDGFNAELSAYGSLKSAVSTFETAMNGLGSLDKFKLFTSTSSDDTIFKATTDSNAAKGTYEVDITRLAQRHKMGSDARAKTDVFTGDLVVTIGTSTMTINPAGLTLQQIRDSINTDSTNPGVTPSIINVDSTNQRLVLTSDTEGYDSRLQVSGTISTALNLTDLNKDSVGAALASLTELDSAFTIDGFAVTASSNAPSTVIDGITFDFKKIGKATLNIDRDTAGITSAVQEFINAYNGLQSQITSLRREGGPLEADSTPLSMQNLMRNVLNTQPTGLTTTTFTSLAELGITTDAQTGALSLKSSTLESALTSDFNNVAELFALKDQGIAFKLENLAKDFLDTNGLIDSKQDGINARIKSNQKSQTQLQYRLDLRETALRTQFATLDGLLGSMQVTSNFLTSSLGG